MDVSLAQPSDHKGILRLYSQFNQDRIDAGVGDSDYKYLEGEIPWAKTLNEKDCVTLVLKEKEMVLAFITLRMSGFNPFKNVKKLAEIDLIVVEQKLRRHGFGKLIYKKGETYLRTYAVSHIMLNVRVGNTAAMHFWAKMHYKKLSSTQYERSDGAEEQTVYMIKKI